MMRHPEYVLLLACVGCNAVFGVRPTELVDANDTSIDAAPVPPDRDRDGIADVDDSCIASIADHFGDYEGDSYINGTDGCPFDYELTDTDGDAIFDHCDPLVSLTGDRVRCVMAFQNPVITRELLLPRAGDQASWNLLGTSGISGTGTGTLVAVEHFEAPTTTSYDLLVLAAPALPSTPAAAVTLWIRTTETAAPSDVGCQLRSSGSSSQLVLAGSTTSPAPIALGFQRAWKLTATIEPSVTGRANVRCTARTWGATTGVSLSAELSLPPGTVGFGIEEANAVFAGLTVMERDDAPTL